MSRSGAVARFLAVIIALTMVSWIIVSCGGGKSSPAPQMSQTQKAAASAKAAEGAISMSSNIAFSSGMATGFIPLGYAPGKAPSAPTTDAIANIDPRLKSAVDKMMAMVNKHKASNVASKAGTSSKLFSAASPTASLPCSDGGTIAVTDTVSTSGTATTHTLSVTYINCYDNASKSMANGTLTAVHTIDSLATTETGSVAINLTDTTYADTTYAVQTEIFALNGTFTNNVTGTTGATNSGSATALGAFTWTTVDAINGNMVLSFTFGSGGTPISDTWSTVVSGATTTDSHTANGTYSLGISAGGQSIALGITLSSLADVTVTTSGATDETINGSITIGWTPDLSQWGCLNGTFTFTTITPIHYVGSACPTSGVVQVNNAKIEFGVPGGYNVKITILPNGPSEVFVDCDSMGGGMCGG